jgi:hypothetical protein
MESSARIPPLREVVAHAWFTMGYPPSRSLVLVEMMPVDGGDVPGFVARIDLPPPRYRRQAAEVLATVARRNQVEALSCWWCSTPCRRAGPWPRTG